jgi:hypothetical protein
MVIPLDSAFSIVGKLASHSHLFHHIHGQSTRAWTRYAYTRTVDQGSDTLCHKSFLPVSHTYGPQSGLSNDTQP